jgi:tetratricopeptide (TPR) repeat protein
MRWFGALFAKADNRASHIRGRALRSFGGANDIAGEQAAARALYEEGLAVFEELDDDVGRARLLHRCALNAMRRGELGLATELAEQALELHVKVGTKVGTRFGEAEAVGALGAIARDRGEADRAFELMERSAALAQEAGIQWWVMGMRCELAQLALAGGDTEEGEQRAREALAMAAALRDRGGRVFCVGLLAVVAAARGDYERAGLLWGAVENEQVGAPNGGWIRHRAACEARILASATPAFEQARRRGRDWTLDEAVEYALS